MVEIGLEQIFNSLKDKEQDALLDLLLHLHEAGAITSAHVVDALTTFTTQLEDLRYHKISLPVTTCCALCICNYLANIEVLSCLAVSSVLTKNPT